MRAANVPAIGLRYWVAISLASIFGCNCGDFVSHALGLGDWRGLLPLGCVFVALLLAERRVMATSEAWYWTAIIVLRTAATNIADLLTQDFALAYGWVLAGLETALILAVLPISQRLPAVPGRVQPSTGGWYWLSMLTAGALGTALGDCTADAFGLGTGYGTLALGGLLLAVLAMGRPSGWSTKAAYWWAIVAVRAAGTTGGDFVAFHGGLNLGLKLSTAITGIVFATTLALWRAPPREP
jgi:uncharacterized membrane-anchored protein